MGYRHEIPNYTVKKVKFKEDQEVKLLDHLCDEHEKALEDRSSLERKWREWVKQANSRKSRADAGPRDSNIDIPNTREYMMQNAARLQTPIFQQDQVMVARPRTPSRQEEADAIEKVMDWMLDRVNLRLLTDEWIEQFQIFSAGIVKTPFITEVEFVKYWEELPGGYEEAITLQDIGESVVQRETETGMRYFRENREQRSRRVGAFPEVIPIEDFIFPMSCGDIYSAPWVTHRLWLTEKELQFRIDEDIYREFVGGKKDGDKVIDRLKAEQRERFTYPVESPDNKSAGKQRDIRETYLLWEVDGEETEIIVTWDHASRTVLSCIENFYHEYHRPFVVHQYKHVHGSVYGVPLTYILEPLHIAYSASINQRLDQASLANEVAVLVPTGNPLLQQADQTFRGGIYPFDGNKDEINIIRLTEPSYSQLPSLEEVFKEHMLKVSSLSDASFGEELAGRPTATGTMQVIEESKQPQYLQLERFRDSLALVVKHMLARYKQFYPEGMKIYLDASDKDNKFYLQEMAFSWPKGSLEDSVLIETKVSSSTMSKNVRKQEIIALMDKMPQVYEVLMGLAQAAVTPNPQAPAASMIAAQLLMGYQKVVDRFMTEFEIAHKDMINPDLGGMIQVGQQINQYIMQLTQQNQQLSQQVQQLQSQLQPPPPGGPQAQMGGAPVAQPGIQGPGPMGPGPGAAGPAPVG